MVEMLCGWEGIACLTLRWPYGVHDILSNYHWLMCFVVA